MAKDYETERHLWLAPQMTGQAGSLSYECPTRQFLPRKQFAYPSSVLVFVFCLLLLVFCFWLLVFVLSFVIGPVREFVCGVENCEPLQS